MRNPVSCAAVLACFAITGCQMSPAPVAVQASAPAPADNSYRLGPGDKIRLITFGEERLSGEFKVNEIGHVSLPLIGEVQAGGLTLEELTQNVTTSLTNGFLKNPRVSVEVLNYRPFYILGEVNKPGEYPFISGLTVTNAVATAGGYTYRANNHTVLVRAQGAPKELPEPLTETTPVRPGDTIRILERRF